jgi:S-DNA-T family DNA segregation ATPase FtsK/SpoIIIE
LNEQTDLNQVLNRNLAGLIGALVLGLVAALVVALATWSVTDPSFSYATQAPARNLLGFTGAAVADLIMQLLGLAGAVALLPLAALGFRLLSQGYAGLTRGRIVAWMAGTLCAAGALAGLPVMGAWPLPTGLGGALGDLLMKVPVFFLAPTVGRLAGLVGFGAAAVLLCIFAMRAGPRPAPRELGPDDFSDDAAEDDGESRFMALALMHHWALVARANLMRLVGRRAAMLDNRSLGFSLGRLFGRGRAAGHDDDPFEDGQRPMSMRTRVEPGFGGEPSGAAPQPQRSRVTVARIAPAAPDPVDDDEPPFAMDGEDDDDDYAPPPAPAARPPVASGAQALAARKVAVEQPAKPIAQVKKPAREQGRMFSGDGYQFPAVTLLTEPRRLGPDQTLSEEQLEQNARDLEGVLDDFGVKGEIMQVRPGPVVTLYELEPAPGVKSSRVIGLADDIARSMSAVSARVAVVPGRNVIGVELPNQRRETVYFRELIASQEFETSKHKLALCLGKTIGGEPVIADLARMPHLLVAGTTGSGKSVAINTMILSLLYRLTPEQCKLIMVDPKMLELSVYDGIPHLLTPVVTDPKKAVVALKWTVREMEDRYRKMSKLGVRNIDGFNARVAEAKGRGEVLTRDIQTGFDRDTGEPIFEQEELALDPLPYIVVIVDEMADLMMVAGKDIEGAIQRIAQMARAAGIHIVMATQRPSVDVITGTIKANFPTRISFQVTSKIDSRTILGEQGAEQLLGQGDMLYMAGGGRIQRVHGPFVADDEVEKIVQHLKRQGAPQYLDAITADSGEDEGGDGEGGAVPGFDGMSESNDLYDQAVAVVLRDRKASTSYVQRRLQIGYNRAASLIERMEKEGLVGPANHAGKRDILVGGDEG